MNDKEKEMHEFLHRVKGKKVTNVNAIWSINAGYVIFDGYYQLHNDMPYWLSCEFYDCHGYKRKGQLFWNIEIMNYRSNYIYFDTGQPVFDSKCIHDWEVVHLFTSTEYRCKKCGESSDKTGKMV